MLRMLLDSLKLDVDGLQLAARQRGYCRASGVRRVELERIVGEVTDPYSPTVVRHANLCGEVRLDEGPQFQALVPAEPESPFQLSTVPPLDVGVALPSIASFRFTDPSNPSLSLNCGLGSSVVVCNSGWGASRVNMATAPRLQARTRTQN